MLKVVFKVPLPLAVQPNWFAFPSGHMQGVTVFYGYLFFNTDNKWLKIISILLLMGVGWSLIYFGFHNLIDVTGGFFVALIILGFYPFLKNQPWKMFSCLTLILATLLLLAIYFLFFIPIHAWSSFYGLIGTLLGENLYRKSPNIPPKWLSLLVILIICLSIYVSIFFIPDNTPVYLVETWSLILATVIFGNSFFLQKWSNKAKIKSS